MGICISRLFLLEICFQRVWKASSKYVCQHLWLARNKAIFKNKLLHLSSLAAHAMGKMVEYLNTKRIRVENIQKLDKEDKWMAKLNIEVIISTKVSQRSFWQLWVSSLEFCNQLSSHSGYTLCFYGA
jgi:hypothetical protein